MNAYILKNMVGDASTRSHRYKKVGPNKTKIFLGPYRIVPGKQICISKAEFKCHLDQIRDLLLMGALSVTTPDRTKITTTPDGRYVLSKENGGIEVLKPNELPIPLLKQYVVVQEPTKNIQFFDKIQVPSDEVRMQLDLEEGEGEEESFEEQNTEESTPKRRGRPKRKI